MECDSLDITTAYLHANLEEELYMKPPPGFEQLNPAGKKTASSARPSMVSSRLAGSGISSSARS